MIVPQKICRLCQNKFQPMRANQMTCDSCKPKAGNVFHGRVEEPSDEEMRLRAEVIMEVELERSDRVWRALR